MKKPYLKNFTAVLLTFCLFFQASACAAERSSAIFSDIPSDADYIEAVEWCYKEGIMLGTSPNQFEPNGHMTRAMLAAVLYRQAGEPQVDGDPEFSDTAPDAWYSKAVTWASGKGLLLGYGNGLFGTDDAVSREMLSVVMARHRGEEPVWTGSAELGVHATRAEAAQALYEAFYKPLPDSPHTSGGGSVGVQGRLPSPSLIQSRPNPMTGCIPSTSPTVRGSGPCWAGLCGPMTHRL